MNVLINTMLDGEKFIIWLLVAAILPRVKICRCNNMPNISPLLALCEGNSSSTNWFPLQNRRQAITWTNADLLSIGPNFSEIWVEKQNFHWWKMFFVKWRSSCPGDHELNVKNLKLHPRWWILEPRPLWFLWLYHRHCLCVRLLRLSLPHPLIHGNKDINWDEILEMQPYLAIARKSFCITFYHGTFWKSFTAKEVII